MKIKVHNDESYDLSPDLTGISQSPIEVIKTGMHNIDTLAEAVGTKENADRFLKELERIRTIEELKKENKKLLDANIDLIQDFNISLHLLELCLHAFNEIPNKKIHVEGYKTSYELANQLSTFLTQNK